MNLIYFYVHNELHFSVNEKSKRKASEDLQHARGCISLQVLLSSDRSSTSEIYILIYSAPLKLNSIIYVLY